MFRNPAAPEGSGGQNETARHANGGQQCAAAKFSSGNVRAPATTMNDMCCPEVLLERH